ncbi:MAG: glycine zipper family protein [Bacteroidetes bacterium]|nr:glycine zipper family protein [Bacteroidota bacterium]
MKTKIFLLAVSLLIYGIGFSQSGTPHKKIYYARINNGDDYGPKRILYDVTDSTVFLQDIHSHSIEEVSCREIEKIQIKKKGTTGLSTAIGAVSGTALGYGFGLSSEHDYLNSTAGAVVGLISGTAIGLTMGISFHKSFIINKDWQVFKYYSVNDLKQRCQQ